MIQLLGCSLLAVTITNCTVTTNTNNISTTNLWRINKKTLINKIENSF